MPLKSNSTTENPPLIAHIIHRLAAGGLENGLVNLINHLPREKYRHAIICLTDFSDFRNRILRPDVAVIPLHKRDGKDLGIYRRMWKTLQALNPQIVHTRNLSAMEHGIIARLAGVAGRIHGEHGRDIYDLDGKSFKYKILRQLASHSIQKYITVDADLRRWLTDFIGVPASRVHSIYNGVDIHRFQPRNGERNPLTPVGFIPSGGLVIGTVGRLHPVKDPLNLVHAFVQLVHSDVTLKDYLRLIMVGAGPLREKCQQILAETDTAALAWLPGHHDDIPGLMRLLDLFVLPSLREGMSNTILEAMASGLPVIATQVGGNPELVEENRTGMLVPPANSMRLAEAIGSYLRNREKLRQQGQAGRAKAEKDFSIEVMVRRYAQVYDDVLNSSNGQSAPGRRR